MKGLLVKDYFLLKDQKLFLAAIVLLCECSLLSGRLNGSILFASTWAILGASTVAVSTVSWDLQNHSMPFLLTLPFSRKSYVLEKFLLAWILNLFFFLLIAITGLVQKSISWDMLGILFTGTVLTVTCMTCVEIPLLLALGPEKSRIMMTLILLVVMVGFSEFLSDADMQGSASAFVSLPVPVLILIALAVSAIFTFLAVKGSQSILRRKEF